MPYNSLQSDIEERRYENGARIVHEDFRFRAPPCHRRSPKGQEFAASAELLGMKSVQEFLAVRQSFHDAIAASKQRLDNDMVVLVELNEERTRTLSLRHVTLMEVAYATRNVPGDLLSLYDWKEGLLLTNDHMVIAEDIFVHGIDAYGPDLGSILSGLCRERH